jgi:hypothetical protein
MGSANMSEVHALEPDLILANDKCLAGPRQSNLPWKPQWQFQISPNPQSRVAEADKLPGDKFQHWKAYAAARREAGPEIPNHRPGESRCHAQHGRHFRSTAATGQVSEQGRGEPAR